MARLADAHPLGRVTALCDVDRACVQRTEEAFSSVALATDREDEFFASDAFDAVLIGSPDHVHVRHVLRALEARKHIFAEKPLAITIEDCDKMANAHARTQGLVFTIGMCLRFTNLTRKLREIVSSGEIGAVRLAYGVDNVGVGGEYYFHGRASVREYVCSLLVQKGVHSLDIFNWILDSHPREVFSYGGLDVYGGTASNDLCCAACEDAETCADFKQGRRDIDPVTGKPSTRCVFRREVDVADNAVMVVSYENGAKLSYIECHYTPEYAREFTFVGTKGRVKGYLPHYSRTGEGARIELEMRGDPQKRVFGVILDFSSGHYGGDGGVINEFLTAVAEGRPSTCDISVARESSVVAIAAAQSMHEGRPIEVRDPDGSPRPLRPTRGTAFVPAGIGA
jgi:predicted dehydrogenase